MHGNTKLSKAMEQWWKDHGGKHDDPQWIAFLNDYTELLKAKTDELLTEHSNDGRFGMSKAGGCTAAAVLKLRGAEAEPFSGSTRVTFFLGHNTEILAIATLRALGILIKATSEGKQIPCAIDPYMLSSTDGLVLPHALLAYDRHSTLSVKSMGYKMSGKTKDGWKRFGFAQYPFDGVLRTNPGYWAQAQAEMVGTGFKSTLFVAVAKDMIKTMEGDPYLGPEGNGSLSFYCEEIPFDPDFERTLRSVWGEAWDAYNDGTMPPPRVITSDKNYVELVAGASKEVNGKRTGTYSPCDYCDLKAACIKAFAAASQEVA